MIVLRTIMNVLPEKQKEVLQTLISLIKFSGDKNGCLSYGIDNLNVLFLTPLPGTRLWDQMKS